MINVNETNNDDNQPRTSSQARNSPRLPSFKMFTLLREAMFINKILTNAEIWYGIKENELGDFEDLDRYLIRKAFQCPVTTPKEAYNLELGLLPICCILKCRRLNYLHYIVKSDENGMLCKFLNTMYENPSKDRQSRI